MSPLLTTFLSVFALAVVLSTLRGGGPERAGALVLCLMALAQLGGPVFFESPWDRVDPLGLLIDTIGLVGFGFIAIHALRHWTMAAAALEMLAASAHFASWVDYGVTAQAYVMMRAVPTFGVFVVLILGTLRHWWRIHRTGTDPDWRTPHRR